MRRHLLRRRHLVLGRHPTRRLATPGLRNILLGQLRQPLIRRGLGIAAISILSALDARGQALTLRLLWLAIRRHLIVLGHELLFVRDGCRPYLGAVAARLVWPVRRLRRLLGILGCSAGCCEDLLAFLDEVVVLSLRQSAIVVVLRAHRLHLLVLHAHVLLAEPDGLAVLGTFRVAVSVTHQAPRFVLLAARSLVAAGLTEDSGCRRLALAPLRVDRQGVWLRARAVCAAVDVLFIAVLRLGGRHRGMALRPLPEDWHDIPLHLDGVLLVNVVILLLHWIGLVQEVQIL